MKKLIDAKALASMRACAEHALPDSCTVRVRTSAVDALGSDVPTWTEYTRVPCKLVPQIVQNHSVEGEQYAVHAGWSIALPYDQSVSGADEIVHSGTTYIVLRVEESPSWHTVRRASLRRVE